VRIVSIGLDTEVVPAGRIEIADGLTWEVPPFKAGHAQLTAGAGEAGNTVLIGHVASLSLGDVFGRLDQVKPGDTIELVNGHDAFLYRAVATWRVPRTDVSVVSQTRTPTVSLITCTGRWLPDARDYAERLVVRGELV
jgi:sortase A